MSLKNILGQNSFWTINKNLTKAVGIESALLLSDLIDKNDYYTNTNSLVDHEDEYYFFATSEAIEESTTLTYRVQKKCIKTLSEKGLIKTVLKGIPAKLHFTICEDKILQIVYTRFNKNAKLDLTKTQNIINNKIIKIDNKNKEDIPQTSIEDLKPPKEKEEFTFNKVSLQIDNPKDNHQAFYNEIKVKFPTKSQPQTYAACKKWIDCIRLLFEKDKYTYLRINEIVTYFRNDDFWSSNFQSLLKLRNKDKNGVMYINRFDEQMKSKNKNKSIITKSSFEEMRNNPNRLDIY